MSQVALSYFLHSGFFRAVALHCLLRAYRVAVWTSHNFYFYSFSGDEKTLPLFQAFTDDYSPPFDHQNSYEISYSPPSTLPPLPPFSQSPPAIPARKALPPSTTVNLCDLHFLTPTSESCDSNFEVGGFEKASLLHGLDSPSNTEVFPDLPSAPPQNARSAHPNLELFNFNAPGEWNGECSMAGCGSSFLHTCLTLHGVSLSCGQAVSHFSVFPRNFFIFQVAACRFCVLAV